MKKLLLALAFAFWLGNWGSAQAQVPSGPIPPSQIGSNSTSGADTSSSAISIGPPNSSRIMYVCGFTVGGLGATAISNVIVTLTGLINGQTMNFAYSMPAGVTVPAVELFQSFYPCIPANSFGGQITLTVPGAAGNTSTAINLWGYYQ